MNYLTTKELAEKWNISVSRIVRLAKAGRIPGARLIGNSWAFPMDIQKPADHRRKENSEKQPAFRFPLYLYHDYSENQIRDAFTPDEASLYQSQLCYLHGDYSQCVRQLIPLLNHTTDRYVRYGALYYLALSQLMLENYPAAMASYFEITSLFETETMHRLEMELLVHALDGFFRGIGWFFHSDCMNLPCAYPSQMNSFLAVGSLYADLLRELFSDSHPNPIPYGILCSSQAVDFSPYALMMLNAYLGVLYHLQGSAEQGKPHLKKACQLAVEHQILHELTYAYGFSKEAFDSALKEEQPDLLHTLQETNDKQDKAWLKFTEFIKKDNFFMLLTQDNYKLLLYAKQQTPHKVIAAEMGISVPSVSRKYNQLYEKTGTHNKKELYELFLKKVYQYDIDTEDALV